MIKVGGIQITQVLWQAVFLAALLLTSGSSQNFISHVPTIPPAMQASTSASVLWNIPVRCSFQIANFRTHLGRQRS